MGGLGEWTGKDILGKKWHKGKNKTSYDLKMAKMKANEHHRLLSSTMRLHKNTQFTMTVHGTIKVPNCS